MLPNRDPPARIERVHESERTRVTRVFLPGRTVHPQGAAGGGRAAAAAARAGDARAAARRRGVAQLVEAPPYPGSIVLVDVGGTSVVELAKPLAVDDLIGLAVELARAVAGMHRRGVMHRDISAGEHRGLPRRGPVPGGLRVGDLAGRDPSRVHAPHRDRRDAGVSRAGADRAYRAVGGSARRSVRAGRDAVRAGHRRAAVRLRRPVAAHPRSPGARAGAAGRGQPGRARAAFPRSSCTCWRRSRTTATRRPMGWSTTWSGAGRRPACGGCAAGRRARLPAASAAAVAAGGTRRGGGGAGGGVRGGAGGPVPRRAGQRRAGGRQDGAGRRAAAGGGGQGRLVRGRQVRPVPARPRVRRGPSGAARPGPAAARRARGRARPRSARGSCRRSAPTRVC